MVTIKPYNAKLPRGREGSDSQKMRRRKPSSVYEQLKEKRDGTLQVYYTEHGWFSYERSNVGDFGTERGGSEECALIYAEDLNTLRSDILKAPLPNKVTEWIHRQKCLAFIVSLTTQSDHDLAKIVDVKPHLYWPPEDESVTWSYEGHQLKYWVQSLLDGFVFMEEDVNSQEQQELTYSEKMKTWSSPTMSGLKQAGEWQPGVPVPFDVVRWLVHTSRRHIQYTSARKHYFQKPWCDMPAHIKPIVPKDADLDVVQAVLKRPFNNPMLLLEAITHASDTKAQTPSNQRLAFIGGKVADMLLTQTIIDRAVVGLQHETLRWPKVHGGLDCVGGGESSLTSSDKLLQWMNACCNHMMYSFVCYKKKIYKHIKHGSEELEAAIRHFTKIARTASKRPETLWKTLSSYDAPRVLSDTLLAIVAAVFLDSDLIACTKWFTNHIFDKDVLDNYIFDANMVMADRGPTFSGDPVTHLKKLAAQAGLPLTVRHLPAPACGITSAGPNVKDAMAITFNQSTLDPSRGRAFCPMALAPVSEKSKYGEERRRRAWNQEAMAFKLPDFNYCTLWVAGHRVGPAVGSASPRSALRRSANLALGGGSSKQTQAALLAVRAELDSAKSMEEAGMNLRKRLEDLNALEPASRPHERRAATEEEKSAAAECKQLVVRCPVDTWPILLHSSKAGELPTASDEEVEKVEDYPVNGVCELCNKKVNSLTQWADHRSSLKHVRKKAEKEMAEQELKRAREMTSNPPISASPAAEMQPKETEGVKGLGVATSSSKVSRSKASGETGTNSSSAASSGDPASQRRTYPRSGSEVPAAYPQQQGQNGIDIDGQHLQQRGHNGINTDGQPCQAYVLWPAGLYPAERFANATYVSDGKHDWLATPFLESSPYQ